MIHDGWQRYRELVLPYAFRDFVGSLIGGHVRTFVKAVAHCKVAGLLRPVIVAHRRELTSTETDYSRVSLKSVAPEPLPTVTREPTIT